MNKKWREQVAEGLAEFRNQDNVRMTLRIIPAASIPAMIKAGDDGDLHAREMYLTITNWMRTADKALDDGVHPACGYCETELDYGEVWGWAVLMPDAEDGMGMVAAYCQRCMARDHGELCREFMAGVAEETGIVGSMLH